ncbi:Ryanodine receptor [Echinococcus granulosus]|uniref:Ryanodine receptor n=1 Tax=Echinococcus granulosus TaxID=6210 RepID=W6U6W0_ECHGR|nr:Ryanodine receptor [Echinococcus granulosus]EUB56106.1 Ryanodine receptor [Echinococcus granulosus]
MLVAYYFLKVPLVIFKREKEISRMLEFEGIWIAEQPSDEKLRAQWDKLVLSTPSFPHMYWDKFVKKKVLKKYGEQYDKQQIRRLLGMKTVSNNGGSSGITSGGRPEEASDSWFHPTWLQEMDLQYLLWKIALHRCDYPPIFFHSVVPIPRGLLHCFSAGKCKLLLLLMSPVGCGYFLQNASNHCTIGYTQWKTVENCPLSLIFTRQLKSFYLEIMPKVVFFCFGTTRIVKISPQESTSSCISSTNPTPKQNRPIVCLKARYYHTSSDSPFCFSHSSLKGRSHQAATNHHLKPCKLVLKIQHFVNKDLIEESKRLQYRK